MGQYYYPVAIEKKKKNPTIVGWVHAHEIGEGLKLMEHSFLKSPMMLRIEALLTPNGAWYKKGIVWAGDYADKESEKTGTLQSQCGKQPNLKVLPKPLTIKVSKEYRYVVNHTKKLYVDKQAVPSKNGWTIHPLPLLTAEGNGSGGGDYYGDDNNNLIGSWTRHSISMETEIPVGYKELKFDLTE